MLHRGPKPLMEFDPDGNFIRGWGDGLFDRPHGLRIDAQDNIWATDVASHVAYKFNPSGRLEMVLGVRGRAGRDARLRPFAAVQRAERGGGRADRRHLRAAGPRQGAVLRRQVRQGRQFPQGVGQERQGQGEFDIPHSLVFDAKGLLYIADRSNARIQVFDADGNYIREWSQPGTPCGLFMTPDQTSGWRTATPARS